MMVTYFIVNILGHRVLFCFVIVVYPVGVKREDGADETDTYSAGSCCIRTFPANTYRRWHGR